MAVGEQIAPLLGAAPGQVVVGDSTTVDVVQGGRRRAPPAARTAGPGSSPRPAASRPTATCSTLSDAEVVAVEPDELPAALDDRHGRRSRSPTSTTAPAGASTCAALTAAAHDAGAIAVWDLSPLGRRDGPAPRPRRRRPGRRLHLQVPERRTRLAGVHLRRRARTCRCWTSRSPAGWATPTRSRCPRCTCRPPASAGCSPAPRRSSRCVALDHALDRFDGVDLAEPAPQPASASPTAPSRGPTRSASRSITPRDPTRARQPGEPPPSSTPGRSGKRSSPRASSATSARPTSSASASPRSTSPTTTSTRPSPASPQVLRDRVLASVARRAAPHGRPRRGRYS